MSEYSDTTEKAFRTALDSLQDSIPASLQETLESLLSEGELHGPKLVREAIRDALSKNAAPSK